MVLDQYIPDNAEPGRDAVGQGFTAPTELFLSRARSLAELSGDVAFFTPGILYSYSRFDKSLLDEFIAETGWRVRPVHHFFSFPVFKGLGRSSVDDDWNKALFGIEREAWEDFRSWCHSVAAIDRERHQLIRLGVQELDIIDPLALERTLVLHPGLEVVRIGAICVDSNQGCYAFDPERADVTSLPCVVRLGRREDTLCFVEALFGGNSPFGGDNR